MYPAVAYAKEFQRHDPGGTVVFVGTGKSLETNILRQEGFRVESIQVKGFVGLSLSQMVYALWLLPKSLIQAINILRSYKANLVIGTGGYFSLPVVVAAWLIRIPRVILEPNARPGLANRIVGPLANRIFLAFEQAMTFFSASKVKIIGTPIREAFITDRPPAPPQQISHILVFGGSQGAEAINSAMIQAVEHSSVIRQNLTLTHQTGKDDYERVKAAYETLGKPVDVQPFLYEMPHEIKKADLIVCRAGASTLAELAACGKVGILIPFPQATHNHQEVNARALEKMGAARVIRQSDLSGPNLAKEIESLMSDFARMQSMSQASWRMRKVQAAEQMVQECLALVDLET